MLNKNIMVAILGLAMFSQTAVAGQAQYGANAQADFNEIVALVQSDTNGQNDAAIDKDFNGLSLTEKNLLLQRLESRLATDQAQLKGYERQLAGTSVVTSDELQNIEQTAALFTVSWAAGSTMGVLIGSSVRYYSGRAPSFMQTFESTLRNTVESTSGKWTLKYPLFTGVAVVLGAAYVENFLKDHITPSELTLDANRKQLQQDVKRLADLIAALRLHLETVQAELNFATVAGK